MSSLLQQNKLWLWLYASSERSVGRIRSFFISTAAPLWHSVFKHAEFFIAYLDAVFTYTVLGECLYRLLWIETRKQMRPQSSWSWCEAMFILRCAQKFCECCIVLRLTLSSGECVWIEPSVISHKQPLTWRSLEVLASFRQQISSDAIFLRGLMSIAADIRQTSRSVSMGLQ